MTVEDSTPDRRKTGAYDAARQGSALFDRSGEGRLRATGTDRTTWLQGLVTNDVLALRPGNGCYAAYLTPQGRMVTDLRVLVLADALLLDVPAVTLSAVRERFESFIIMEDVVIKDVTSALGRLAVHGPRAASTIGEAAGPGASVVAIDPDREAPPGASVAAQLAALEEHGMLRVTWGTTTSNARTGSGAGDWLVAATRELGQPGFDIYVPADAVGASMERLLASGAVPGDAAVWDVLRVEHGTPAFGIDMDQDTIPLEAGIQDRAISFTKGCYVGQEIIIRVMHRGHGRVARRLVRLAPATAGPGASVQIRRGDVLWDADGARDVGRVTSAVMSPALGHAVALGYVQREWAASGTVVLAGDRRMRVVVG